MPHVCKECRTPAVIRPLINDADIRCNPGFEYIHPQEDKLCIYDGSCTYVKSGQVPY